MLSSHKTLAASLKNTKENGKKLKKLHVVNCIYSVQYEDMLIKKRLFNNLSYFYESEQINTV